MRSDAPKHAYATMTSPRFGPSLHVLRRRIQRTDFREVEVNTNDKGRQIHLVRNMHIVRTRIRTEVRSLSENLPCQ